MARAIDVWRLERVGTTDNYTATPLLVELRSSGVRRDRLLSSTLDLPVGAVIVRCATGELPRKSLVWLGGQAYSVDSVAPVAPFWIRDDVTLAPESGRFNLVEPPPAEDAWELEDGSGLWELEDGAGFWELERS